MNDFLLVLTGGGISLVSSVAVTWLQARHLRKSEVRVATRESTRQLTGLFIAERDSSIDGGAEPTPSLAEAEMMAVAISDRRTRDRMRDIIRLLRELPLPELQELSGMSPERARRIMCDHALEVLGAHFRGERLPSLPVEVQRMLSVEDEALNIHTGGSPKSESAAASAPTESAVTRSKVRQRPKRSATSSEKSTRSSTKKGRGKADTADPEEKVDSAFWND
ncbi:MAG: hypothetical protein M0026_18750 [Nocardiopsaceae bacterium]|nr:hypothetical protein [Nocardiopsaceae bacterium]